MGHVFEIHPDNPQQRLILQAADIIAKGGVAIYPTDSAYALGCHLEDRAALDKIRQIRRLDDKHYFTLICRNLTDLAKYAQVDNAVFRLLKALTPGPYTFILQATKDVPRRLMHPKRKTIGIRVPDNAVTQALLEALGEPMMSTTLQLPGAEWPLAEPDDIIDALSSQVDVFINSGFGGVDSTTVIDVTAGFPEVVRRGKGEVVVG